MSKWERMRAAFSESRREMAEAKQAEREGRDWRGQDWDATPRGRWRLHGVFVGPFFMRRERR